MSLRRVRYLDAERRDQNDTVAGTPWLARKQAGTPAEQRAATLALGHAGTPAIAKLDALGRSFLTIADNGTAGRYQTRTVFDVEGNALSVTDARGIVTATQVPDLLARTLRAVSPDAGEARGYRSETWRHCGSSETRFTVTGTTRSVRDE